MADGHHLCCFTKNDVNPAYAGARLGASRVADNFGVTLSHFVPETPDDLGQQRDLLREAIALKPDAILMAPVHPTALNPTLSEAADAGIPLVFFVSRAEAIDPATFVTSNNRTLAFDVAAYLIDRIGGAGSLAVLDGAESSPTSGLRTQGFLDAVARHPDVRIVAQACGNYQRDDAEREMAEILRRHAGIDGVLAANDFMALGAIDAFSAAGRRAPIVGVNAMPDAVKAIQAGDLLATAAFDAMKMASVGTEAAIRVLRGEAVPEVIELPAEIVDTENCAHWDQPYEDRPLPRWADVI